ARPRPHPNFRPLRHPALPYRRVLGGALVEGEVPGKSAALRLSVAGVVVGEMTVVDINVVSDVMCPWCFVGKKRLEKALAEIGPEVDVAIHWRPYQLDPTLPPEGKDRRAYFAKKFGDPARVAEMHRNL